MGRAFNGFGVLPRRAFQSSWHWNREGLQKNLGPLPKDEKPAKIQVVVKKKIPRDSSERWKFMFNCILGAAFKVTYHCIFHLADYFIDGLGSFRPSRPISHDWIGHTLSQVSSMCSPCKCPNKAIKNATKNITTKNTKNIDNTMEPRKSSLFCIAKNHLLDSKVPFFDDTRENETAGA